MNLRPYQTQSVEELRAGVRARHRNQILVAPTGSGKTVIAAHLLDEVQRKGTRATFMVDRIALVGQTSTMLWASDIRHGIAQGDNTFGRSEKIQVASAQTIEKRGFLGDTQLLIVDECHTVRKAVRAYIDAGRFLTIGLTATPFTKGLGEIYTNLVNVTTTNKLIEQGFLSPLKVYAAKAPNMKGAKVVAGEWSDKEITERGRVIIGDIVREWRDKTKQHFGGPVKTLVFTASVSHGEDLCREFNEAGFNFQQVSYKDGNDQRRADLIAEFRKPDSSITGLVSCEALAKGFDVPDVLCGIAARPYRKSFSSHIQQIGRVMRIAPGKEFALWLDHCGNYLGFLDPMVELFENGVDSLDDGEHDANVRDETEKEKHQSVCGQCGYVLSLKMDICPACGHVRPRRNTIQTMAGALVEVGETPKVAKVWYLQDQAQAWRWICSEAAYRKQGDHQAALRFARAQYKTFFGMWPRREFDASEPCPHEMSSHIKSNVIRWALSKRKSA